MAPFMPQSTGDSVAVLLIGLCGTGSWPAVRQSIAHSDYRVFSLHFLLAMSCSGMLVLAALSKGELPTMVTREHYTDAARSWGILAGALVGVANALLAAAMPMAGMTLSLPVFNGVTLLVGVGVTFAMQGNDHPVSLAGGVAATMVAIVLSSLSKPDASDGERLRLQAEATPQGHAVGGSPMVVRTWSDNSLNNSFRSVEEFDIQQAQRPIKHGSVEHVDVLLKMCEGSVRALLKGIKCSEGAREHDALVTRINMENLGQTALTTPPAPSEVGTRPGLGLVLCVFAGGLNGSWPACALLASLGGLSP